MTGLSIRVRGIVQGVGFRPYVWHLAHALSLDGWVCNDADGVLITVNGPQVPIFLQRLPAEAPPLARISTIETQSWVPPPGRHGFHILDSAPPTQRTRSARIGADAPPCPACLSELCDPNSRRWRYAFTTCTHCGPRYTVSRQLPWDRQSTSLEGFPLCARCQQEYDDPADRRFHAETLACPTCGPRLQCVDPHGNVLPGDPIHTALERLKAGQILAIKGIGGFHLACDARQAEAVARLRERKQRESKPFAIMALNAASLTEVVQLSEAEQVLLQHASRPIVLAEKTRQSVLPDNLAPDLAWQGIMLPASPLHYLLWHEAAKQPEGTEWLTRPHPLLLVMTSANPNGEPLVTENDEALERLGELADALLWHDRPIVARADDSVIRVASPDLPLRRSFLRRGRGFVPEAIPLSTPLASPPLLALGGDMKNTVCLIQGQEAILSSHIGTLDNIATRQFQEETIDRLLALHDAHPKGVVHDQHPAFASTEQAFQRAQAWQCPTDGVFHHAAHLAAVVAEHGLSGPVIGLALDGVGFGENGEAWGGELLRLAHGQVERLGHLTPLPLPGGDRAAREPWRMALAATFIAGLITPDHLARLQAHFPELSFFPLISLLEKNLRCPLTTSLGRWFDAAAGLLGVCSHSRYEGEAAMRLESLAIQYRQQHGVASAWPQAWQIPEEASGQAVPGPDFSPMVAGLLATDDKAAGAARFHATLAAAFENWLLRAVDRERQRDPTQEPALVLCGGCTVNRTLFEPLRQALSAQGLSVYEAEAVPCGDGGLALGQAWLAAQHLALATVV